MSKRAFTLSEFLIAIVVIGVVAILTVPNFIYYKNNREYRTLLKKSISAVNNAIALSHSLYEVTAQDYKTPDALVNGLFGLRLVLITGENKITKFPGGKNCQGGVVFTTSDGIIYCVTQDYTSDGSDAENSKCNFFNTVPCGSKDKAQLWIDVNGVKGPNEESKSAKILKDQYQAQIYARKIVPFGDIAKEVLSQEDFEPKKINKTEK